jgi:hypothetical protein
LLTVFVYMLSHLSPCRVVGRVLTHNPPPTFLWIIVMNPTGLSNIDDICPIFGVTIRHRTCKYLKTRIQDYICLEIEVSSVMAIGAMNLFVNCIALLFLFHNISDAPSSHRTFLNRHFKFLPLEKRNFAFKSIILHIVAH